jgi:electron transfer flavoprotein beta subunit
MKILVPVKCVPDPDHWVALNPDGRSIDASAAPLVLNPFDAIALEEAVRLRERSDRITEIVVTGIGGELAGRKLRTALAVGADRAVFVRHEAVLDPWNVSGVLESLVRSEAPGLVLMGKQAVDDDANQAGQFLAARLGWPQATFASRLTLAGDGLRVERESDDGIETLTTTLPAVVTCDLRLNEPRYASLPAIMKARRKPMEEVSLEQTGHGIEPKVRVVALERVDTARNCILVESVDELISRLRDEAKVLS